jgi:hypothetical protein
MKKETLIQQFKDNQGWLQSKDFGYQPLVYAMLYKMIENQEVEKVKKGLFKYIEASNYNEQEDIAKYYPTAVLCLFSAWHHYELSTTVPYQHHLAFPHKSNPAKIEYPPIKFYYWSEEQFQLGISQEKKIRIYDIEKSVCDAVKFRNKIGDEITYEVLKNYMQSKSRNIEKLMSYAKKMRLEKIINPMLKPLL